MGSVTKNQHYVPQSYLRCFSADNSSIGTFCIKDGRCFENATIKGQAKKEWFYGLTCKVPCLSYPKIL